MSSEWKAEIVACGDLIQDDDDSAPPEEAERRWNRYVELADAVTGAEGPEGVAAIVASLKAEDDYGAYQAAHAALSRFPHKDLGEGMAQAAGDLLALPKDNNGNVLLILAHAGPDAVRAFTDAVRGATPEVRAALRELVEFHESEEWLTDEKAHGFIRIRDE
ncbi:hypothetical protein ACFWY9_20585 [Amycolatopsis sp. NPDC059027]|uniref:hypothetical protein n=1 Tax=unclassified Amycolatopsis TaxID=2618356 RepID=UPI003670321A